MNIRIDFANLVAQLLPGHKRQPNRLKLLRRLIRPLENLFHNVFEPWRRDKRIHIATTAQVISLEGYLDAQPGLEGTTIETYRDEGLRVGLGSRPESDYYKAVIALRDENAAGNGEVPTLSYYEQLFGGCDFIVKVPATADFFNVTRIIERYKLALTTYKIIFRS